MLNGLGITLLLRISERDGRILFALPMPIKICPFTRVRNTREYGSYLRMIIVNARQIRTIPDLGLAEPKPGFRRIYTKAKDRQDIRADTFLTGVKTPVRRANQRTTMMSDSASCITTVLKYSRFHVSCGILIDGHALHDR